MMGHWSWRGLFGKRVAVQLGVHAPRTPIETLTQLAPLLMPGCQVNTRHDLERLPLEQLEDLHERLLVDLGATGAGDIRRDLLTALYPLLVDRRVEAASAAVCGQLAEGGSTRSPHDGLGSVTR
ncbi:hypothetical protein [Caulobacter endophyticus]|uniref:Uncharacterized protein n=1 Tax=Caulobacter endophyticus TaxID=2172652 RepID=A0A2T9KDY5_9CAUL|nr:hypothetical protein [Caulobacter endophyticus]PVM94197.1 hypothetical protein DDF67_00285 [Caulobacter endophyticus]